ncbi:MAG TPA: hypothetical protein PK042_00440 [Usitatibacteraceae bacterium]|nr:hypothetical protein [Usitatibacteraceae bacterium]
MRFLKSALAALAAAACLQAAAQVTPAIDYTDMWWNPAESGWGISIRQKLPVGGTIDALFAVWYTYDPRATDPASAGGSGNVPLWLVMPGGSWLTPTTYAGLMYVLTATPYPQAWNPSLRNMQEIGSFRFEFTDAGHGVFTYNIAPPAGLAVTNPAYGLPALSGTKAIQRQGF